MHEKRSKPEIIYIGGKLMSVPSIKEKVDDTIHQEQPRKVSIGGSLGASLT
jgi:hypothetical protein